MKKRIFELFFLLSAIGLAYLAYIFYSSITYNIRIQQQQKLELNLAKQSILEKHLAKQNAEAKARVEEIKAERDALVDAAPDNGESKIVYDEPEKLQEDTAPEIPKEPIVKVTKKYTDEEIKQAREYVGNYRYIQKEINKQTLRCMSDNNVSGEEALATCTNAAMKRFNMKTDAESKMKLETKYKQQLQIALST